MQEKISVLIPSYNEEDNISACITRVKRALKKFDHEIIVIDDGSADKTAEVASKFKSVKVISYKPNRGKGYALKRGIKNSAGSIIAQVDTDCQFLPEEIPKLIDPIIRGRADITFGSRFLKGSKIKKNSLTKVKRLANYVDSLLASFFCLRRITDVQAGFKAFKANVLKELDFKEERFGYEPEIAVLASKKGCRIMDVPITYEKRVASQSNIKFFRDTFHIIRGMMKALLS